jgi:ABC-type Zn uptake system ZnuABC Zn-binding protein ZnuA
MSKTSVTRSPISTRRRSVYKTNADAYAAELKISIQWIIEQVGQFPAEKRLLVTNHEAFGYFAERYGFTVVGTVIESFSSNASPPPNSWPALIDQIRSSGAPAIFLDASDNPTFARQIAAKRRKSDHRPASGIADRRRTCCHLYRHDET